MNREEQQFNQLVARHKATIYSVCLMFADCQADANDLMQEVLVKLWRGYASFQGRCDERGWVWRVAMNTCITQDTRRKRHAATKVLVAPDLRRRLLDDCAERPLLEMAEDVALWRRQNLRQGMAAAVATALWTAFLLCEIWGDVTANISHAVSVFVVMVFVIGSAATAYFRINAATSRLLGQIEGVKSEE